MSNDAKERVRLQREARLRAGWHEVRTWVPSKQDADDLLKIARARRKRASSLTSAIGNDMDPKNLEKMLAAIAAQGSTDYSSPSGPVLEALSDMAADGYVEDVARGFQLFAKAKPANAKFVTAHIPAKILNQYLFKRRGLAPTSFFKWEAANKDWAEKLKKTLRSPLEFAETVDVMASSIAKA